LFTTHPFFLNSVATSCKTGSATCIIYGISFGYLFNAIPVIFIAGTLFLADYWLGAYGIGLAVIGYLSLLPHYLNGSLVYSSL
jgi:Na+/H+-translocating membrane pyrophosphatase